MPKRRRSNSIVTRLAAYNKLLAQGSYGKNPPVITGFTTPASYTTNLNIPITTFTATDEYAIAGYLITESASVPTTDDSGWGSSLPATYTVAGDGDYTLYAWVKNVAGLISQRAVSNTTVVVSGGTGPIATSRVIDTVYPDWIQLVFDGAITSTPNYTAGLTIHSTTTGLDLTISAANLASALARTHTWDNLLASSADLTGWLSGGGITNKTATTFDSDLTVGNIYENITTTEGVLYTLSFKISCTDTTRPLNDLQFRHDGSATGNYTNLDAISTTPTLKTVTVLGKVGGGNVGFGFRDKATTGAASATYTITEAQVVVGTHVGRYHATGVSLNEGTDFANTYLNIQVDRDMTLDEVITVSYSESAGTLVAVSDSAPVIDFTGATTWTTTAAAPSYGGYGHGLFFNENEVAADDIDALIAAPTPDLDNTELKYFIVRYAMAELEPIKDTYDFTAVTADLNKAAEYGMTLVVMIQCRSFNNSQHFSPQYFIDDGQELPCLSNPAAQNGWTPIRWNTYYTDRMKLLHDAMAAEFNNNDFFEGVTTQETSLGLSDSQLTANAYDKNIFKASQIQLLTDAANAFNNKKVFYFFNFIQGGNALTGDIIEFAYTNFDNIVAGGPDCLHENTAVTTHVEPRYLKYNSVNGTNIAAGLGTIDMFGSFQNVSHKEAKTGGGYYSMQEQFDKAKTEWGCKYLFWNNSKTNIYKWYDGTANDDVTIVKANPTFN